jgi:hypothetical protein
MHSRAGAPKRHTVFPPGADGFAVVRSLRDQSSIETAASLCYDVCQMITRYCEEPRWAILDNTKMVTTLRTAPVSCETYRTNSVHCTSYYGSTHNDSFYMESRGLIFQAYHYSMKHATLENYLTNPPRWTHQVNWHDRTGEDGEIPLRMEFSDEAYPPRERIYSTASRALRGTAIEARYGRLLVTAKHKDAYTHSLYELSETLLGATPPSLKLSRSFLLDANSILLKKGLLSRSLYLFDLREGVISRTLHFPKCDIPPARTVMRCGDDLVDVNEFCGPLISVSRLDLRAGWVPFWRVALPRAMATTAIRARRYLG